MIDDELKDALRVDPSPEFVARVRTRIAEEPAPSAWRWSWTLAAAGALAAAVILAFVVWRPSAPAVAPSDVAQAVRPSEPAAEPSSRSAEAVAPPRRSAKAFALPVAPPRRSANRLRQGPGESAEASAKPEAFALPAAAEPEVLLDPAETRALRNLIAGVRNGRIDLAAAQRSALSGGAEFATVTRIVIAPITIEPIAPQPGAEGARP